MTTSFTGKPSGVLTIGRLGKPSIADVNFLLGFSDRPPFLYPSFKEHKPKHEYPAALEANPAAVGKLLMEHMCNLYFNALFFGHFFFASFLTRTK